MADLDLDATQLDRYSRHIIMEEIGAEGQASLLDASVLCVGAGGLGSPIIQYLAAAGVGRLGIVDDDVVERSNLQRQVVHGDDDVGRPKVESAAEFVADLNPEVETVPHETRLTTANVDDLLAGYDFVVDGSDNFATRYLVNDACTLAGIPFSHGAIYKFEGQVITFDPRPGTPLASDGDGGAEGDPSSDESDAPEHGPCYRCLFPEPPDEGTVPDCATTGVLGALPGTVGCLQATETLKCLLDVGDPLVGRLLLYDALDMTFEEVPVRSNPDCPVCGADPAIESVREVDYDAGCSIGAD